MDLSFDFVTVLQEQKIIEIKMELNYIKNLRRR